MPVIGYLSTAVESIACFLLSSSIISQELTSSYHRLSHGVKDLSIFRYPFFLLECSLKSFLFLKKMRSLDASTTVTRLLAVDTWTFIEEFPWVHDWWCTKGKGKVNRCHTTVPLPYLSFNGSSMAIPNYLIFSFSFL